MYCDQTIRLAAIHTTIQQGPVRQKGVATSRRPRSNSHRDAAIEKSDDRFELLRRLDGRQHAMDAGGEGGVHRAMAPKWG